MTDAAARGAPDPASPPSIPSDIVDQAVQWAVRLQFSQADAGARERFAQWLRADSRHALAWQRMQSLRDDFASVPPNLALPTLQAADALRKSGAGGRRKALKTLAFGGVSVLAVSAASQFAPWQRWRADASTGTGEQRTLRLEDGTTVVLNTDTAIDTRFDPGHRVVALRRGEVLVTTGHDARFAAQPFWVQTPFGSLRALGTRFVVRIEADHARVSVQEGAVEMHPGGGAARGVAEPGTTWTMSRTQAGRSAAPPIAADGWADGVIAGNDMRLADVLAELERYRTGRIACDPRVGDLRVSGAYRIADTDRALRFLAHSQPIRVSYLTRFWVMVGPAEGH
ncbi:FecR domain-containing protein [Cupriavidus alkaliphilus]|uniref:FecR domain-containing protein n=1 Tax=Cupriavidus alkaliphilus TaxID=942866 RepID=UPI001FC93A3D|nr:FecR domain-containing protein [Cupriavidus alkaliphilus]